MPGIGLDTTGRYVTIQGYVLDLFNDSPFPYIWGKLVDAIQKECQAWIRVSAPDDTTALKDWMTTHFSPLTNYKFIYDPDGENAFWMRDFGPWGFYYGDEDSVGFIGMGYYPGRPIDESFQE